MLLTAKQVRACTVQLYYEGYSDGAVGRGGHTGEIDWEGITSSLNILDTTNIPVLGDGFEYKRATPDTCTMRSDSDHVSDELYPCNGLRCSNCGELIWDVNTLHYCPNCGHRVLEAV